MVREGYIDVSDKSMLMTLSWWQFLDVSDRIRILVTIFGCRCPKLMLKDTETKPSPTSQSCHQHILSPTSVTNIDVAVRENVIDLLVLADLRLYSKEKQKFQIYFVFSDVTEFSRNSKTEFQNLKSKFFKKISFHSIRILTFVFSLE